MAERTRFELVVRVAPYVGLANRWFQPLTHLSGHASRPLTAKGCANIESFWGNTKNCGQNLYICMNRRVRFEPLTSPHICITGRARCAGPERIIEKQKWHETDFRPFTGSRRPLHPERQELEMQFPRDGRGFAARMPGRDPGCARVGPKRRRVVRRLAANPLPAGRTAGRAGLRRRHLRSAGFPGRLLLGARQAGVQKPRACPDVAEESG